MNDTATTETRQGKTGIWTFVLKTDEGKILATSQWGTNYEFQEKAWSDLPLICADEVKSVTQKEPWHKRFFGK